MAGNGMAPARINHRRSLLLAAARHLEPFQQGELDYLCGLYSVINAIRLLVAGSGSPLGQSQAERLYAAGIRHLSANSRLRACATSGMGGPEWRNLTDHLCRRVEPMVGIKVRSKRPFARRRPAPEAIYSAIESSLASERPVLLLLGGTYDHYTVVSGMSAARLLLFDSFGFHWVTRSHCSIGADPHAKRHQIAPASLTILCLAQAGDDPA